MLSKFKNYIKHTSESEFVELLIAILSLLMIFVLVWFGFTKRIDSVRNQSNVTLSQSIVTPASDMAQITSETINSCEVKNLPTFYGHASFFESMINLPSDEDIELLAHLIMGEAGSDYLPDEMRIYVGSVVLNRVSHDKFPDTLEEVIYQSGQYACTWDGNFNKEPTDRCYEIATDLLTNGSVLPEDVVFQAQFIQGSDVYEKIGNTYFCRL